MSSTTLQKALGTSETIPHLKQCLVSQVRKLSLLDNISIILENSRQEPSAFSTTPPCKHMTTGILTNLTKCQGSEIQLFKPLDDTSVVQIGNTPGKNPTALSNYIKDISDIRNFTSLK